MGASVIAYWPKISPAQLETQPGFYNDCKAWGDWMAERENHDDVLSMVRQLGATALLTFKTDGVDDAEVDWVTPLDLEQAARVLRDLVLAEDPRTERIVATYALSANGEDAPGIEFAQDLADISAIARFAHEAGAERMTLEVNW